MIVEESASGMKMNCKQTMAKFFSPVIAFAFLLAGVITLFSFSTSFAPTKLSDAELSDVEGQALFNVTQFQREWIADSSASGGGYYGDNPSIPFGSRSYSTDSQDVVRLELGLDAFQIAHMKSFKLGYYYGTNGHDTWGARTYDTGWDHDTTNYFWGTTDRTTALQWTGVFIDFGFDNYSDNSARVLNYVEIGTMSCSGKVTGTINTVTALVEGGTGTNGGVMFRQTAAGQRIITYENELLSFVFATKYRYVSPSGSEHDELNGIFIKMPFYHNTNDETHP